MSKPFGMNDGDSLWTGMELALFGGDIAAFIPAALEAGDVDAVMIQRPQDLGATYEEVMANLERLAANDLLVFIENPERRK